MQPSDLFLTMAVHPAPGIAARSPRMPILRRRAAALMPLAAALLLVGCGATAPRAQPSLVRPAPAAVAAPAQTEAATPPLPLPRTEQPAPPPPPAPGPASQVLNQTDAILRLAPADLAREIARLGDAEDAAAENPLLLATALAQTRQPVDTARALGLVQRVLANTGTASQALHPLARLLEARLLQQRRLEDQLERQAQQLRDAQRRNDQLNERLEAVRAIERSLTTRPPVPAAPPSAPGSAPQRSAP